MYEEKETEFNKIIRLFQVLIINLISKKLSYNCIKTNYKTNK